MVILEMEGKFTIRRVRHPGQTLTRLDKYMDFSMGSLAVPERVEEFKTLLKLSRLLFFLPFEINKKV
jgi:hypothetical protein